MELLWQDKMSTIKRNNDIDNFISNSLGKIDQFRVSIRDFVLNKIQEVKFDNLTTTQLLDLISEKWNLWEYSRFILYALETGKITLEEVIFSINNFVKNRSIEVYNTIMLNEDKFSKPENITDLDFSILIYSINNWILDNFTYWDIYWVTLDLENRFRDWNLDWWTTYEELKIKYENTWLIWELLLNLNINSLENIWITNSILWKYIIEKLNSEWLLNLSDASILKYLMSFINWEITINDDIRPVIKNKIKLQAERVYNIILSPLNWTLPSWKLIQISEFHDPDHDLQKKDQIVLSYSIKHKLLDLEKINKIEEILKIWFDDLEYFLLEHYDDNLFEEYLLDYLKNQWIIKYYILSKLSIYDPENFASYKDILMDLYIKWEINSEEIIKYFDTYGCYWLSSEQEILKYLWLLQ